MLNTHIKFIKQNLFLLLLLVFILFLVSFFLITKQINNVVKSGSANQVKRNFYQIFDPSPQSMIL
ncbi:hypothetical protein A2774_01920 [Candidatus Roizmanbacteria bacterium RIFCSPHIGHO2_01_FULL_39_12c]|uniref:Uncharacterized protein n=1 Tax=Candidatus Roizmanbacteria bacterium RIFCSPHIGHO2_01_FULL_39_12c TaxID=1802031 RepID=A0A1F7GDP9_9BACT|nr:MAG: hypothetical protein A2774_01920 [Candidatus Roizmanbacteria bacterium RIFCSPHIGHO2_01_FULL_39_12c]